MKAVWVVFAFSFIGLTLAADQADDDDGDGLERFKGGWTWFKFLIRKLCDKLLKRFLILFICSSHAELSRPILVEIAIQMYNCTHLQILPMFGCEDSDKSSLVAIYFISLQKLSWNNSFWYNTFTWFTNWFSFHRLLCTQKTSLKNQL